MVFKKHKFYKFFSEMTKRQKSIEVKCFCRNFTPTIDKEPFNKFKEDALNNYIKYIENI